MATPLIDNDIDNILREPISSQWLKNALATSLTRDPVDAANDAEILAMMLEMRADALLFAEFG